MLLNGYPADYYGNQYTWFMGRVEAVTEPELNDPEEVNRVRVRIFGQQDMDFPVEDLPLCTVIMPPTHGFGYPGGAGAMHGLLYGDMVTGFYMDHDMQMPVITGVIMGKMTEDDELLESPGGGSGGSSSSSSSSTSASNQSAPAPSKPATQPSASKPPAPQAPQVVMQTPSGVEYNDTGVEGASSDKSVPATLRHNNPLGNNMSGLAGQFNPQGSGQNLDGTNTIASFTETSDGYGYSYSQMALNSERAGMVDNGRLYTTPEFMGDGHQTAGYKGTDIVGDVGNNNKLYFDTWSPGWESATRSMQNRETGASLRKRTSENKGLPSTYDYGQNAHQMERGFKKMKNYKGF